MSITRFKLCFACGLAALSIAAIPVALAQLPMTNPAGISLTRESAESWSGDEQINPAGATLELTSAFDASTDDQNLSVVTAYVGQLDEVGVVQRNAAGVAWTMYEEPAKP